MEQETVYIHTRPFEAQGRQYFVLLPGRECAVRAVRACWAGVWAATKLRPFSTFPPPPFSLMFHPPISTMSASVANNSNVEQ